MGIYTWNSINQIVLQTPSIVSIAVADIGVVIVSVVIVIVSLVVKAGYHTAAAVAALVVAVAICPLYNIWKASSTNDSTSYAQYVTENSVNNIRLNLIFIVINSKCAQRKIIF